jgi:hypothetical protein
MTAIYKGKVYKTYDDNSWGVKLESLEAGSDERIAVPYTSPDLILDPTDDEINNICPDYENQERA